MMGERSRCRWELSIAMERLEQVAEERGLYYETDTDRENRAAVRDFFSEVWPTVEGLIQTTLTRRQREVLLLYFLHGKTQEDIAAILNLTQSTVSRHLYGVRRGGRKVGGAIPKLRKTVGRMGDPRIAQALAVLKRKLNSAA